MTKIILGKFINCGGGSNTIANLLTGNSKMKLTIKINLVYVNETS